MQKGPRCCAALSCTIRPRKDAATCPHRLRKDSPHGTQWNPSFKAAQADAATGGGGDAESAAETGLEDAAFVLARALANHSEKTSDLDRLGKVGVSKSEIMKLRTQELVNKTTAIRNLGTAAVAEAGVPDRGITAARVAALTAAIAAFSNVMSTPRGQIVNRSALLKEVETRAHHRGHGQRSHSPTAASASAATRAKSVTVGLRCGAAKNIWDERQLVPAKNNPGA